MRIFKPTEVAYTLLFIIGSTIQLLIFKHLYPRADFTFNSHSYVQDAISNIDFRLLPAGYPKFLYFIHYYLSQSDVIVTTLQYLILQVSAFIFFNILRNFYPLPTIVKNTIFLVLIFNPLL